MKQNKLLILSLLASFLLLTLTSFATAANTVTFGTIDVCPQQAGEKVYVAVTVDNDVDLAALDIVGQVVSLSGGVDLMVTGISFSDRMGLPEVLDQRYPIGDLGGGFFRFGAVKLNEDLDLAVGTGEIAVLELEFVSDCVLGSAGLDPASFDCDGIKNTLFVDPDGNVIVPDPITSGAVNVVNADPFFTNCPTTAFDIYWKSGVWGTNNVTVDLDADDPDLACGCDELSFYLEEGPGSVNMMNGVYQFTAGPADIGCHHVKIRVEDEYGAMDYCEFDITVLNNPPEFTVCPDETINILWGQTATATVTAVDPDLGPAAVTYTLESYDGPASSMPDVNPMTGEVNWVTDETNDFIGLFNICVKASDGAPSTIECPIENSDVCCYQVYVEPKFRVTIQKSHDIYLGHYTQLSVDLDGTYESMEMGGFDFLITYDNSVLSLVDAEAGALLDACGWEYFTYRFGYDGNCGTGCPSGAVRLVALAETNNGPYHPDCFSSASGTQLAVLNFYVANNHTFDCQYVPVQFFWMDCGDNAISSKFGDTLFLEDRVFNLDGDDISMHGGFPNLYGTDDVCLEGDNEEEMKEIPLRAIDFKNGGVDIICDSVIDDRGDINMNGIAYEIADAVMFTNYFISGLAAFGDHVEGSIAASDANADGATLTVADLVYLVRVIQGDAVPYPKLVPNADNVLFSTQLLNSEMTVNYSASADMGAALFVFNVNGDVGQPVLNATGMDVKYEVNNSELRVLVYSLTSASISAGEEALLTIPVSGSLELKDVDASDFYGNTMVATTRVLPTSFSLQQNYPNPFNPYTTIDMAVPVASEYSLEIYNVAGQKIRSYSGFANAGVESVVWDGKDASGSSVASGIYFYKVVAKNFSDTKQMILLK